MLGKGHEQSMAASAETGQHRQLQGTWTPGPSVGLAHLATVSLHALRTEWTQNFVERMSGPGHGIVAGLLGGVMGRSALPEPELDEEDQEPLMPESIVAPLEQLPLVTV